MKKLILSVTCLGALGLNAVAQNQRKCGDAELLQHARALDPEFDQKRSEFIEHAAEEVSFNNLAKTTAIPVVPVVFHVILSQAQINSIGGEQGIKQRCEDQIAILNKDYNRMNKDSINIPAVFKPYYANVGIKFGLAHRKPNGTSTPGYEIKPVTVGGFSSVFDAYVDAKVVGTNGLNSWDEGKYLNVWVINPQDNAGILGVAVPPSFGVQYTGQIGVVVNYRAFGKKTNTDLAFISGIDSGRTLVHEIGHFFELPHTFGENGSCPGSGDVDDGFSDTPPEADAKYGNPTFPHTDACSGGNGVMFMNYMNYSDDKSLVMFTTQQKTKMNQAINGESIGLTQHPELLTYPTNVATVEIDNPFDIYPNPSNGNFNISFLNASNKLQNVTVTNTVGQRVYDVDAEKNTSIYNIDISGLSKGVYFVQCRFDEGTVTRKIVVE